MYKEAVPACGLPVSALKKKKRKITTPCISTASGARTSLPWPGYMGTEPQPWASPGGCRAAVLPQRAPSSGHRGRTDLWALTRVQCSVIFKSHCEGCVCCLSFLNKLKLHKIPWNPCSFLLLHGSGRAELNPQFKQHSLILISQV